MYIIYVLLYICFICISKYIKNTTICSQDQNIIMNTNHIDDKIVNINHIDSKNINQILDTDL